MLAYFNNTWTLTEVLFSGLQGAPHPREAVGNLRRPCGWRLTRLVRRLPSRPPGEEAFYRPPYHNLRHPFIFYYAHPAVLYVNKLRVAGILAAGLDEYYETIFETGVDEMSWDDLSKNDMDWPSVAEVTAYRRRVHALMVDVITHHPCLDTATRAAAATSCASLPAWALFMAFEHERIHLETSSVLLRELPLRLVDSPQHWRAPHSSALSPRGGVTQPGRHPQTGVHFPANPMLTFPAGSKVTLGKRALQPSFGWDNEYGAKTMTVPGFRASQFLVTNGEFHAFVVAGGYSCQQFWSDAGWKWRAFRNAKWPPFWVPDGPAGLHAYALRLLFQVVPMAWDLPVVVNAHEARAFCAWRSQTDRLAPGCTYRLLTEPEHHVMRAAATSAGCGVVPSSGDGDLCMSLDSAAMAADGRANLCIAHGSESAVDAGLTRATAREPCPGDTMGNVWQWCEDNFCALPGFSIHPYYEDFSTPCFDGQHSCIQGGSFMSTGDLASRYARFHFRPHFHQQAGFRLAVSLEASDQIVTSCLDAPPPYAAGWVPPRSGQGHQEVHDSAASKERLALTTCLLAAYASPADALGPHADALRGMALEKALQGRKVCAAALARAWSSAATPGATFRRALVIGGGVGDAAFALATTHGCAAVVSLEHSLLMHSAAERLRSGQSIQVQRLDGGDASTSIQVALDPALVGRLQGAVTLRQCDPGCLPPDLGVHDAVLVLDVLDGIPSPRSCLGRMAGPRGAVAVGGVCAVACGHAWRQDVTPQEAWLAPPGSSSVAGIHTALGGDAAFRLLSTEEEVPVLHRAGPRSISLHLLHLSLWQRVH